MKNKYRLLKIFITIIILGFLLNFSLNRFDEKNIGNVSVHFLTAPNAEKVSFLDETRVKDFVFSQIPSKKVGDIDISSLEKKIREFPSVDSANVYLNLNGNLNVEVMQRVPVFRLSKGEDTFYVDTKGEEFPISKYYAHTVMLVSGDVERAEYQPLMTLIETIKKDDFLHRYFIGIRKEQGSYYMITHDGNFAVELGELENVDFKLIGFKTFVEKYLVSQPMHKYSKISLRFNNQIVTTLRAGYQPEKQEQ